MRKYHGQAPTPTFPHSVKPAAAADVRDPWRRHLASDPTLGARAFRVALGLLNFVDRAGFTSVGIARLSEELATHRRVIERGLAALVAAGYLERERGAGQRGNGGWTCSTRLKVPAATASASPKVPATADQGTGQTGRKVPATVAGQTLLTNRTLAAAAPGLEAGSATAESGDDRSRRATADERRRSPESAVLPIGPTAGPGGEVLRLIGELETSMRAEPRPVRDVVLSALRLKLGLRASRQGSGYENSAAADECGGSDVRVPQTK